MRIIGGKLKGRIIKPPKDLPVRPTTDFAKEGLFNILQNRFDFSSCKILDLFAGTGHIAYEFSSRGSEDVVCVDKNAKCLSFIRKCSEEFGFHLNIVRDDVFNFLEKEKNTYDIIFADPPYDLINMKDLHQLVFRNNLLKANGWLIIEHGERTHFEEMEFFKNQRRYGGVNFSFFQNEMKEN